jgi:hypothetical protein
MVLTSTPLRIPVFRKPRDKLVLEFVNRIHQFGSCVSNSDFLVEALLDDYEDVAIDGRTDDPALFLAEKLREVGSAA